MRQINCYIPIKIQITGRLSEAQLEQLGETLLQTLTERIAYAERTILSANSGLTLISEDSIQEKVDQTRLDDAGETYRIPFYDGSGTKPLPIKNPQSATQETSVELADFRDDDEVYAALKKFFPNLQPQGNTVFGVYGIRVQDQTPYLFFIIGIDTAGSPQFDKFPIFYGKLEQGKFVASNASATFIPGKRYRLEAMTGVKEGVPYEVIYREEPDGKPNPIFSIPASDLKGKVIRFGVAAKTKTATRLTPLQAPWDIWWASDALPAEPEGNIPAQIWWWYGRFNVKPASVRADPLVRAVFENWERSGAREDLNPLWLPIYYSLFYKAFCQQIALQMLATSRQHMNEWLAQLNSDRLQWQTRFNNILQGLRPAVERVQNFRYRQVTPSETSLESLRQNLAYLERLYQAQQSEGPLPGGIVLPEDLTSLQSQITQGETQRETQLEAARLELEAARLENARLDTLLQRLEQLNPLLVLLTIREGKTVRSLKTALLDFNTGEQVVTYLQEQLLWLINKTQEAEKTIAGDVNVAYELQIVQEAANERLAPWLQSHAQFKESVEGLIGGGGILEWLGLAGALLVLTFVCPPVGIIASLGVSVGVAYSSVSRAVQLSNLSRVRIAQQGFRPFVSDAEVTAAIIQAVLDVGFALLEAGMLARSATQALRQAAEQQVARQLSESLDQVLKGWQALDAWPEGLNQSIRQKLLQQAGAGNIDELVATVKQAMLRRYENRLLQFQQDFERLLKSNPSLSELQAWVGRELPSPQQFFTELAKQEQLFRDAVPRLPTPPATPIGTAATTATKVEARLLSKGYRAEAIESLSNAGMNVQRGSAFYRQLLSAGQTVRDFINTFYHTPGFDKVITNWAQGGNTQEGTRFIMRYCLKEFPSTPIRFEWPFGLRYTSTGGETWARYVDIVIDGRTTVNPGSSIYLEFKSWTSQTLAKSPGKIRFQLTRDRALFDPDNIRWIFDAKKVSRSEVLNAFVKIIRDDPYLAQVWGGTDNEIRAAVSQLIEMF